jgi:glycosyltransferase involved in cell wall biosynthesis
MKILQVNKFFYLRGGAERHYFELIKLLENKGHKIVHFAMEDKRNAPSPYAKYFVGNTELEKPKFSLGELETVGRMIYSFEAKRKVEALIKEAKLDLVHLHNIYHQISPSILGVFRKYNLPVIMTLHDYKLICPNYKLFAKRAPCERCKKYRYFEPIVQKCIKNSRLAGAICGAETTIHKLCRFYDKYIDLFISPSQFLKDKFVEWGFNEERIVVLPHFIDAGDYDLESEPEDYFVYFGRLSAEKGLGQLLEVMKDLPETMKLKIIGRGEEEEKLKVKAKDLKLKNVEFLGPLWGRELKEMVARSRFAVLPAIWYEVFGLSILEANALSRPVIAPRIGGILEVIEDGENGILYEPLNKKELKEKIVWLWENKDEAKRMGGFGRARVLREYNPEVYYKRLLTIYSKYAKIT